MEDKLDNQQIDEVARAVANSKNNVNFRLLKKFVTNLVNRDFSGFGSIDLCRGQGWTYGGSYGYTGEHWATKRMADAAVRAAEETIKLLKKRISESDKTITVNKVEQILINFGVTFNKNKSLEEKLNRILKISKEIGEIRNLNK
ncbi:5740_t:CDS:2 [Gigaspora rosea]|nr:5740_t:CDS:2 [Gigaspora rosea]